MSDMFMDIDDEDHAAQLTKPSAPAENKAPEVPAGKPANHNNNKGKPKGNQPSNPQPAPAQAPAASKPAPSPPKKDPSPKVPNYGDVILDAIIAVGEVMEATSTSMRTVPGPTSFKVGATALGAIIGILQEYQLLTAEEVDE